MKKPAHVRLSAVVLVLAAVAAGGIAMAVAVIYGGFYNVAATHQHLRPTYRVLQVALSASIERHSTGIPVPRLDDPVMIERGLRLYDTHCAQCHGAPGVAPAPFALGLTPLPTNVVHAARVRPPEELYWVVKNGIKMTAMPAWQFRFSELDLWAVVAAMQELTRMTTRDYAARVKATGTAPRNAAPLARGASTAPDPVRGKLALKQYACTTCHSIPGIVGAYAPVGPPLDRVGSREYIAGVLPNSRENMERWLREPQKVSPRNAMPDLGVSARDAADMAEYLYTLR